MDVEFLKVLDVVSKHLIYEVGLNELMFESVFVVLEQALERVQSDLVLLDVGVNEHHTFYLVVDTVPDEVILKDQLLAEHETVVSLREQLVDIRIVFPDQLVEDVLQDSPNFSEGKDVVLTAFLHFFVGLRVVCEVLHGNSLVVERVSEGRKGKVAFVNYELQVVLSVLLIENKSFLPSDT